MSIEDVGTDNPDLVDPIEARKAYIRVMVTDATARAGATIIMYRGFEAMLDPRNKSAIKEVFGQAKRRALQKAGVLNENFQVIPGQEIFIT